jgi:hypothetical protein
MSYEAGCIYRVAISKDARGGNETPGTGGFRHFIAVTHQSYKRHPQVWLCVPLIKWDNHYELLKNTCFLKLLPTQENGLDQIRTPDIFQLCALDLDFRRASITGKINKQELQMLRGMLGYILGVYAS